MTCAILASAGPQRSRMLATLYKDDRTHKLPVFDVLKKMYVHVHGMGNVFVAAGFIHPW